MSIAEPITAPDPVRVSAGPTRLACAAAAVATLVPFALCSFTGTTGSAITADLVAHSTTLQIGAMVATLVAAGLLLSAVRLGRRIGGTSGAVVSVAGSAVAVLYAAYYAAFGAGAVVTAQMLDDPGPGVGEATALLVNAAELTRYAPTLTLLVAVAVARRTLPRAAWISAAVLAALMLVPFTTWAVALIAPVWLAVAAAQVRR